MVCGRVEEGLVVQSAKTTGRTGDEAGEVERKGSAVESHKEPLECPKQRMA